MPGVLLLVFLINALFIGAIATGCYVWVKTKERREA
jgi:hypothetical protein